MQHEKESWWMMDSIKEMATASKKVLDDFFKGMCDKEIMQFRSFFHLRPTTDSVTIVSTLPVAPMRGLPVSLGELKNILPKLRDIPSFKDDVQLLELGKLDFKHRDSVLIREEDIQAFLIRDMVMSPGKYNEIQFVTSELDLPQYGDAKRADVIGYKDGTLYDIELKNERLTSTITQAKGYVDYLKGHLSEYSDRLSAFPNFKIGNISDVKGIAVVPNNERSSGRLEEDGKSQDIELWLFTGFQIKIQ
jgi:hypothetical protein